MQTIRTWLGLGLAIFLVLPAYGQELPMPARSFTRFDLDADTARGLWAEAGLRYAKGKTGPVETKSTLGFGQVAYGGSLWEAGLLLPYTDFDTKFDLGEGGSTTVGDNGFMDTELWLKLLPLRSEALDAGAGVALLFPTGDEDKGLGAGEFAYAPFATASIHLDRTDLRAYAGYRFYDDRKHSAVPDGILYGGGLYAAPNNGIALRAEFSGQTIEVPGANENIVTFEPGIDYRPMTDAPFRVIFRSTGAIGLTKNAVDWGVGGSVVFTVLP